MRTLFFNSKMNIDSIESSNEQETAKTGLNIEEKFEDLNNAIKNLTKSVEERLSSIEKKLETPTRKETYKPLNKSPSYASNRLNMFNRSINKSPSTRRESFIINSDSDPKSCNRITPLNLFTTLVKTMEEREKVKENKKKDDMEVLEENYIEPDYDTDDEYEELNIKIEKLDDLIAMGNIYDDLMKQPPTKEQKTRDKKPIYELNGKKYSINLETINKLQAPLKKLQEMIGLDEVKNDILNMILYFLQHFEIKNQNMLQ